ncbi:hypothetical protein PMAYCL1PPCAC_14030, partial [Pristionchus mayeri]
MDFLLEFRRLCERLPVLFYAKIVCSLFCAIPSLLLLFAVLRSSIHANCRILLCLWAVDQMMVYAMVSWLSVHYIFFEKEYFSDDFYPVGISIRNPSKYYQSSPAYFTLFVFAVTSVRWLEFLMVFIYAGALTLSATIGAFLSNLLDITAFVTNIVVVRFSKRRDQNCHKQLNERYQVDSRNFIARAMMPVYFISSSLKV